MKKLDYAKLVTEQANPRSRRIDRLTTAQILALINREDTSVPNAVRQARSSIHAGVELIVRALRSGGRLFFAGAGTSGRLGVLEAAECPPTFNTPPSLVQAVIAGGRKAVFRSQEGAEDRRGEALRIFRRRLRPRDILVGIAASGVTPFVEGALRAAREKGAATILVCSNARTPLQGRVDCVIAPKVGPEIIAGSTRLKAGTATKLVLNMLTVASMIRLGKVYRNWMVDLQPKSRKLRARGLSLIERLGETSPKQAESWFKKSGGDVKLAILMARRSLKAEEARGKLMEAEGFLEKALHS